MHYTYSAINSSVTKHKKLQQRTTRHHLKHLLDRTCTSSYQRRKQTDKKRQLIQKT